MILILACIFIFIIWFYALFLRGWLIKAYPSAMQTVIDIEDKLWMNSRTVLIGRAYWIGGILVAIQSMAASAGLDWTPLLNEISFFIPEKYRGLVLSSFLMLTGLGMVWLRKNTIAPVDDSPVVVLPPEGPLVSGKVVGLLRDDVNLPTDENLPTEGKG